MRVRLLRDARIRHNAGEIVEASPAEAAFLTSVGSAVEVRLDAPKPQTDAPSETEKPKKNGAKKKA